MVTSTASLVWPLALPVYLAFLCRAGWCFPPARPTPTDLTVGITNLARMAYPWVVGEMFRRNDPDIEAAVSSARPTTSAEVEARFKEVSSTAAVGDPVLLQAMKALLIGTASTETSATTSNSTGTNNSGNG